MSKQNQLTQKDKEIQEQLKQGLSLDGIALFFRTPEALDGVSPQVVQEIANALIDKSKTSDLTEVQSSIRALKFFADSEFSTPDSKKVASDLLERMEPIRQEKVESVRRMVIGAGNNAANNITSFKKTVISKTRNQSEEELNASLREFSTSTEEGKKSVPNLETNMARMYFNDRLESLCRCDPELFKLFEEKRDNVARDIGALKKDLSTPENFNKWVNKEIDKQVEQLSQDAATDIQNLKSFIGRDLLTAVTAAEGKIDIKKDKNLKKMTTTLATATKQKGTVGDVKSLAMTEAAINESIDALIKTYSLDPENPAAKRLNEIRGKLIADCKKAGEQLQSNEGVKELIFDSLNNQAAKDAMSAFASVGKDAKLNAEELKKLVQIPLDVPVSGAAVTSKLFVPIVQKRMVEYFASTGGAVGTATLDPTKLTEENKKAFTKAVSKDLQPILLIEKSIAEMEQKHGITVNEKQHKKIIENLMPVLEKLGPEYLAKHSEEITKNLSSELYSKRSTGAKLGKNYTIPTKSVEHVGSKLLKEHEAKSALQEKESQSQASPGKQNTPRVDMAAIAKAAAEKGASRLQRKASETGALLYPDNTPSAKTWQNRTHNNQGHKPGFNR